MNSLEQESPFAARLVLAHYSISYHMIIRSSLELLRLLFDLLLLLILLLRRISYYQYTEYP